MGLTELIADAERELRSATERLDVAKADVAAASARLASLRAGIDQGEDLVSLSRTDAVSLVLQRAEEPLRVGQIIDALAAAGRSRDKSNEVFATLKYLMDRDRVIRVARGLYQAA